ncbi:tripartite tricarboxylate transporter TctA [Geodermatophilus sp. DF01-2]|uniref:tripartite tricarboxylate transporter permease n=1 Tax=Geodermatophilus sp. DF01-2 TaxID=2559610 RepID=UPI0010745AA3|nr:tripartite tricarboxylate transporter permease [Geodermatophilus sp. DF01_2]TFV64746.1 tripartite tricarboxylate transporter TctA [Geodermatophilus sp. DF01_2]
MNPIEGLLYGLELVFTPELLLAAFVGAAAGTAIGVLPGLGPVAGAALILPLTFTLPPAAGLIMIAGVYAGSMYGGSTTSVLMNMPGEAASVVTAIDGYEMTRKGRAGPALSIMAVGSFIAGTIAIILVTLMSPIVAEVAFLFGPAEYLALTGGGLLVLARVAGGSTASGYFPMVLGVLLGTVGIEQVTGVFRYTFGLQELALGFSLVPVAVGLYGIAEIFLIMEDPERATRIKSVKLRELLPSREEWRRAWAPWGRGSLIGFFFGLLPGPSATLSSFAAYRTEQAVSKNRDRLGKGAVEGVAGPEAANNGAAVGSLVPLLSLGLPFSATFALMLAAMVVQGIQPGPLLIEQRPDIFWSLIASMYVANVMLLILNLPLVGVWVSVLRIPKSLLMPGIMVIAVIGAYSTRFSPLDVWVLVIMGALGYLLRKLDFALASMIVGLVLGPFIEKHLREGLFLSRGDFSYFLDSGISIGIWSVAVLVMLGGPIWKLVRRRIVGEESDKVKLEVED